MLTATFCFNFFSVIELFILFKFIISARIEMLMFFFVFFAWDQIHYLKYLSKTLLKINLSIIISLKVRS